MKKGRLVGLSILVLALFLFGACEQPLSQLENTNSNTNTSKVDINELPPPDGVRATAYGPTGVITVSWNPVANANGYRLYRRTEDSRGAKVVEITLGGNLFYEDIIAFDNEFEARAKYTYRVVAVSNFSSGESTGQGGWSTIQDGKWFFIQNSSKDSNTVSFSNLRAQGEKLAKPANLKVKDAAYSNGMTASRQVSWTVEPAVNYRLYYGYAGAVNVVDSSMALYFDASDIDTNQRTFAYELPIVYGDYFVEVIAESRVAALASGNNAKYYQNSDSSVLKFNYNVTSLKTPTNFDVTESDYFVNFEWDKMDDAASYRVFRLKRGDDSGSSTQVYESWTEITSKMTFYTDEEDKKVYSQTSIEDLYIKPDVYYQYAVISVNGRLVSLPATEAPVQSAYVMPALTASFDESYWDIQTKDWKPIKISWEASNKDTYKLYRTAMKLKENSTGVYVPYDGAAAFTWEPVAITGLDKDLTGSFVHVMYDKPTYRRVWKYKLEAYNATGVLKGTSESIAITDMPYNNAFPISITANPATSVDANDTFDAYDIEYNLGVDDTLKARLDRLMRPTETVRVSRAPADGTGRAGDYVQIGTFNLSQLNDKNVTDNNGPGYFIYKAEVVENGVVTIEGTPTARIAAVNPSFTTAAMTLVPGTNDIGFSVNVGVTNGMLGTKLVVRYAKATADNQPDGQNAARSNVDSEFASDYTEITNLTLSRQGATTVYLTGAIPTAATVADTYWCAAVYVLPGNYKEGDLDTLTPRYFYWQ